MPPRKSNVSTISNGADDGAETTPAKAPREGISVEDLSLPKSMVARLAKGVLPANTQIHKDALLALHKSATVFVSYIAAGSSENALAGGKKTVMPLDVMSTIKDAEFEEFLPRLEAELKKYNDMQSDKRNNYRKKVKEGKAPTAAPGSGAADETLPEGDPTGMTTNGSGRNHPELEDEDRPVKKFKAEGGEGLPLGLDVITSEDERDAESSRHEDEDLDEDIYLGDLEDSVDEDGMPGEDEDEIATAQGIRDEALDGSESDSE